MTAALFASTLHARAIARAQRGLWRGLAKARSQQTRGGGSQTPQPTRWWFGPASDASELRLALGNLGSGDNVIELTARAGEEAPSGSWRSASCDKSYY